MPHMKCKKCQRQFEAKKANRFYCCEDCRVNDYRGTKSKWEKHIEVLEDTKTAKLLGYTILKNSDG